MVWIINVLRHTSVSDLPNRTWDFEATLFQLMRNHIQPFSVFTLILNMFFSELYTQKTQRIFLLKMSLDQTYQRLFVC